MSYEFVDDLLDIQYKLYNFFKNYYIKIKENGV